MEVVIQADARGAADLAARLVVRQVKQKPESVLGLATGRTMEQVYRRLVEDHRGGHLSFAGVRTFNLDEYIGLPPDDVHSYRHYMQRHFFDQVDVDPRNTHLPDGLAADLKQAAADYEARIAAVGGIDLQLLGIGVSGHIGFNEPLSALRSRTRDKALTPETRRQNAPMFGGDADKVPARALTMGVGTILEARRLVVVVTGGEKAEVLARAVEGPITAMVSASAIQLHPDCKVIVDEAASVNLRGRAYYQWIYENEPEWQEFRAGH